MIDLVLLMLSAVALAWCADHVAFGPVNPKRRHRLVICTILLIILLAGFAGLRTRYNDTGAYRHAYELITGSWWEYSDKSIGSNPLFNWINYRLKLHGVSTQNFLMFWAFLTVGCYLAFLHRYSVDYPLTIFLLFTTGCYTFVFAGIKQAAAVGVALIAVTFALKRKWAPFAVSMVAAILIHPYAFMYFLVPFAQFRPWRKKTYWMLVAFLAAGFLLRPLLGSLVSVTTLLGEEYTVSSFTGEGVNVFRVLVSNVPLVLSFLYRERLFADSTGEENLVVNLAMLNGAIMFIGLFGTANYFGRLANYFLIFQTLSLPWMLKKLGRKDGRLITLLAVLGYLAYFYYANAINQPFDHGFARLSLSEYFSLAGG